MSTAVVSVFPSRHFLWRWFSPKLFQRASQKMSLDDSSESLCASFQITNENNHKVKESNSGVSNALPDLRWFLIPAVIRKIGKPWKRYSHHLQLGDGWRLASFVYVLCRWYFWSLRAIIREEKNPFVKGKKEKKKSMPILLPPGSSLAHSVWNKCSGNNGGVLPHWRSFWLQKAHRRSLAWLKDRQI